MAVLDVARSVVALEELLEEFVVVVEALQVLVPLAGREAARHVQVRPSSVGELPVGLAGRRLVGLGQIEEISFRVEQETRLVLMIDSVGGIVLGEGRYGGANVLDAYGFFGAF